MKKTYIIPTIQADILDMREGFLFNVSQTEVGASESLTNDELLDDQEENPWQIQ